MHAQIAARENAVNYFHDACAQSTCCTCITALLSGIFLECAEMCLSFKETAGGDGSRGEAANAAEATSAAANEQRGLADAHKQLSQVGGYSSANFLELF